MWHTFMATLLLLLLLLLLLVDQEGQGRGIARSHRYLRGSRRALQLILLMMLMVVLTGYM
jgi:hypothetical protein